MASDPTEGAYSAPQIQLLDLGGEGWVKEERGDRKKGKGMTTDATSDADMDQPTSDHGDC